MSHFTQIAKDIKNGNIKDIISLRKIKRKYDSLPRSLKVAIIGAEVLSIGFDINLYQRVRHTVDYAVSKINSPSELNYQVHGKLELDGKPIIVSDKKNPSNYMILKMRWDSDYVKFDGATYEQDKFGEGLRIIDAVISPNVSTVEYNQLLRIAQDEAKKHDATLTLPDCDQTANNIAGYMVEKEKYTSKNKKSDFKAVRENYMPFTYHQAKQFQKLEDEHENIRIDQKSNHFISTYMIAIQDSQAIHKENSMDEKVLNNEPSSKVIKEQDPITSEITVEKSNDRPTYSSLDF